jgi:hypothetical protein
VEKTTKMQDAEKKKAEEQAAEKQRAAEEQSAFGRAAIFKSIETNLNSVAVLAKSIGQGVVGVTETRYISAGGIKLEVSIKFMGTETNATVELDENTGVVAVPKHFIPDHQISNMPCRYGAKCREKDTCSFDHWLKVVATPKVRPCTYLHTDQGCSNGTECGYSHALVGVECKNSNSRVHCATRFCPY